jgi:hypothetical protein
MINDEQGWRSPPPTRRGLVRPEAITQFRRIRNVRQPRDRVVERLRQADEKRELEPALMRVIGEVDETPHGPTEIADQMTVRLELFGEARLAAIVTKGRASQQVRSSAVSHQLVRAAMTPNVDLLILAAVGDIQQDVKVRLGFHAGIGKARRHTACTPSRRAPCRDASGLMPLSAHRDHPYSRRLAIPYGAHGEPPAAKDWGGAATRQRSRAASSARSRVGAVERR